MTLTPAGRKLARATPIWGTHAEVESLLPDRDPDLLRSNLRALSSVAGARQTRGPGRAA
jgi:hypothetical protein